MPSFYKLITLNYSFAISLASLIILSIYILMHIFRKLYRNSTQAATMKEIVHASDWEGASD